MRYMRKTWELATTCHPASAIAALTLVVVLSLPATASDKRGDEQDAKARKDRRVPKVEITLEGTFFLDSKKFPALKVHFTRAGHKADTLLVRFPEIIEAHDAASGTQVKFYQDNRLPEWPVKLECEPLDLPPTWEGSPKALHYTMRFDNGMVLKSTARVDGVQVVLCHTLDNGTSLDLHALTMWNCVQLVTAPNLADPLMERTKVPVNGRLKDVRKLSPGFKPYPKERAAHHRFHAYEKGAPRWFKTCPATLPHPGHPDDPEQAMIYWQIDPAIDSASIVTFARDGNWGIMTSSEEANMVWTNPGITCHHADASVPSCPPGGTAKVTTTIKFLPFGPPK